MTEQEVTSLLIKLADIGITGIMVRYDGAGDSGQIEEIQYCTEPVDDIEEIEDKIDYHSPKLNELNSDLEKAIEDLVYKFLLEDIEDWYNNEGGYGTMLMCTKTGNFINENNCYRQEIDTYMNEGQIQVN
jgi:hypothetical protein